MVEGESEGQRLMRETMDKVKPDASKDVEVVGKELTKEMVERRVLLKITGGEGKWVLEAGGAEINLGDKETEKLRGFIGDKEPNELDKILERCAVVQKMMVGKPEDDPEYMKMRKKRASELVALLGNDEDETPISDLSERFDTDTLVVADQAFNLVDGLMMGIIKSLAEAGGR
jgi:hypothetical protein